MFSLGGRRGKSQARIILEVGPCSTRRDVEQFQLAFDTDLAPIVGQQVTLSRVGVRTAGPRRENAENGRASLPIFRVFL
jgi:hypothetical protein